jgi:hypothetical protein
MAILNQFPLLAIISDLNTAANSKAILSVTRPLSNNTSEYLDKKDLDLQFELLYDAFTTLKIHHHSVSGSPNCKPPGWPEMSGPAVKMPPHRSKALNRLTRCSE